MLEKIAENLDFVKSSNLIRGISCSRASWCKVTRKTPVSESYRSEIRVLTPIITT